MSIQSKKRPDPFNADQIRAATFVRHIEIHDTLGSTNDRAAELAREANVDLPALVVAGRQSAGRGRGRNIWWSGDGALTFSVLLEPAAMGIHSANWPQLSLTSAVAVCDALARELKPGDQRAGSSPTPAGLEDEPARLNPQSRPGIKWPNDVVIDGRKVCGILIESPGGAAPANNRLIIGFGINVNNSWRAAPPAAGSGGIALSDATGKQHDLQVVLIRLLQAMQERVGQLGHNDPAIANAWQQCCELSGRNVRIESGAHRTDGKCLGITIEGALIIETATGRRLVYSGTVGTIS